MSGGPASSASIPFGRPGSPSSPPVGRVLLTLGAYAAYFLAGYIPVPGLDPAVMEAVFQTGADGLGARTHLSVVSLGIAPIMSAFILVEIAALLIPALRRKRDDVDGRDQLAALASRVSLVVAGVQAVSLSAWMERFTWQGEPLVKMPDVMFRVLVVGTLVASTVVMLLLIRFLTVKGFMHGIASLVVCSEALNLYPRARAIASLAHSGELTTPQIIRGFIIVAIIVGAALFMLSGHPSLKRAGRVRLPSSGLHPLMLPGLVVTTGAMFNLGPRNPDLMLELVVIALGALALGMLWHRNRDAAVMSAIFLAGTGLVAAKGIDGTVLAGVMPGGVTLLTLTAVGMDAVAEWRDRVRLGDLGVVLNVQTTGDADTCSSTLLRAGIPCHLRSLHYRTMLQWLGPYLPISVMVPVSLVEEARDVLIRESPTEPT